MHINEKLPKGRRTLLTHGLPASSDGPVKPRKVIHPLGGELKLYEPRDTRGAVHRTFAECKDTEESVLEFVGKYGLLETRPEDRNKDESLEDFYSYRKNVATVLDFVDKGDLDVAGNMFKLAKAASPRSQRSPNKGRYLSTMG